jgi:DNA primase
MDKAEQKARMGTMPSSGAGSSRIMPVSRADQALRMILADNAAWGALSSEEHHLLCELPGQHGAAFNWLDHQHMEHGAQNWAALAMALQGEAFESFVQAQMNASVATGGEFNAAELRTILNSELAERLKSEELEVLQLFVQSPENSGLRARYEALKTRRLSLLKTTPLV